VSFTNGLGIALQEIYFLECLFDVFRPRRSLVIGNSFGWSALAVALLDPEAQVIALDAGFDQNALAGLELTNALAADAGVRLSAVKGVSPADVPAIARAFDGPIDFAFVDGLHTNEQVVLDWRAAKDVAAPDAVYLFHDVRAMNLDPGIERIRAESGMEVARLPATPSGMALGYPASRAAQLASVLALFAPGPAEREAMRAIAWRHAHRHRARWARSLAKRANVVRRMLGREPLPLP